MSSGASFTVIKQNQYIRRFRSTGTVSADRAKSLKEIGFYESWIFKHMVNQGVFIRSYNDRYYMDEFVARSFCWKRNITISTIVMITIIIFSLITLIGAR